MAPLWCRNHCLFVGGIYFVDYMPIIKSRVPIVCVNGNVQSLKQNTHRQPDMEAPEEPQYGPREKQTDAA